VDHLSEPRSGEPTRAGIACAWLKNEKKWDKWNKTEIFAFILHFSLFSGIRRVLTYLLNLSKLAL